MPLAYYVSTGTEATLVRLHPRTDTGPRSRLPTPCRLTLRGQPHTLTEPSQAARHHDGRPFSAGARAIWQADWAFYTAAHGSGRQGLSMGL